MAIAELVSIDASESFSGLREVSRIRLSSEESRNLRYVLCEWGGEVMGASSAAQLEALAADPVLLASVRVEKEGARRIELACKTAWERAWIRDQQEINVGASHHTNYHGWEMTPADRWCDDRSGSGRRRREGILRAWRALKAMADERSPALVILNALYGDLPPGLPIRGLWDKATDTEYRRVVRYAADSGGSGALLDEAVRVDRRKVMGESEDNRRARLAASGAARTGLLRRLAHQCERLIVDASLEYRQAWREAS